jgi:hypothetical protein
MLATTRRKMQKMTLRHTTLTRRFVEEHHDNCTKCLRHFLSGERTHLGYTASRKLVYVGECCSNMLKETIIRHSYQKRQYTIPSDQTTLWRFMDFTKFVSLLKTNSLFFTRADQFADPFEGAKGLLKNKKKWDKHHVEFFINACTNLPDGIKSTKSEKEILNDAKRLLGQLDNIGSHQLKETFINCWHENEYESEAMWKLYTSSLDQGIAIKTNYKKLYNSLNKNPSIHIGRINYIDFNNNFAGINDSFWFKRKSFEHENEVRAIYQDRESKNENGKLIPIDLNILIEKIYLSPTSQEWFKELVEDILLKYNLKWKINESSMKDKPFH